MKIKLIAVLVNILMLAQPVHAQKVINLSATGSETWNWSEKESTKNMFNQRILYNVSQPTLTVFQPDSAVADGVAVIICPGGAFQLLSIDEEGFDVARWLNKKGITAFVLKYRLAHSLTDDPVKELFAKQPNTPKFNEDIKPIVAMDIADGEAAITYVRKHSAEYRVAPNHIGIIGFSAGGTIVAGLAYNYDAETRPDFVAPIYPYVGSFHKDSVPKDAPPMFIVAASDDQFGFNITCLDLYKEWITSKHSAELHIYAKGGHGFGMKKQNIPTDTWIERFGDWLNQQGFIKNK